MHIVALVRSPARAPDSSQPLDEPAPCDRAAVDAALQLAEAVGQNANTVAITASPIADDPALLWALRRGVKQAIRVWGPDLDGRLGQDRCVIAELLATTLRHVGFDLVLTGDRSADHATGMTGPAIAQTLTIPFVCSLTDIAPTGEAPNGLLATSTHGKASVTVATATPLLCAVKGSWPLRPQPPTTQEAPPIIQLDLDDLEFDPGTAVSLFKRPEVRPAQGTAQMLQGVDELCESLLPFGVGLE